jgi:predicted anti-sigma-YlaC factor YlaD
MNVFHSCERAAELMSQALDEPLDLADQMRLRIHLSMCSNCEEVEKQMATLHTLAPQLGSLELEMDDEPDPPADGTR